MNDQQIATMVYNKLLGKTIFDDMAPMEIIEFLNSTGLHVTNVEWRKFDHMNIDEIKIEITIHPKKNTQ